MKPQPVTFLSIKPVGPKEIYVGMQYSIFSAVEDDGMISCFIPGFNISFSTTKKEDILPKGKVLLFSFSDYFFKHTNKGLKGIALELHKLGFKANNDMMTVKNLINNKAVPAKFKTNAEKVSPAFLNGERVDQELEVHATI